MACGDEVDVERSLRHDLHLTDELLVRQLGLREEAWLRRLLVLLVVGGDDER